MHTKVTVILFLVLMAGITVLNLATPDRLISENENRQLQQLPDFSWQALLDGSYTADFERYVTDQFVARDQWVSLKTFTELTMRKHSSGGVYFADDYYLIEMFDQIDRERYAKNLRYVGDFTRRARQELGVEVHTILAPTASLVLRDKLPRFLPEVNQNELLKQAADAIPGFVDVSEALIRHSGEYVYYRTDHHWTSLGAAYAYADWRNQLGLPSRSPDKYVQETLSDRFYGTTFSKASLFNTRPDTITAFLPKGLGVYTVDYNNGEKISDSMYERSYLDGKDKYSVFLNSNQPIVRITTGNTTGGKLLLIKDSYANSFVQMALGDYTEIVVLDLRYYKQSVIDYIRDNGVTDVLVLYNLKGFSGSPDLFYITQ